MRPVSMNRPRGAAAGAVVRAQPVTETSLMESGMLRKQLERYSGITFHYKIFLKFKTNNKSVVFLCSCWFYN